MFTYQVDQWKTNKINNFELHTDGKDQSATVNVVN